LKKEDSRKSYGDDTGHNEYRMVHHRGHRFGGSSFLLQDPEVVFKSMLLKRGECFVDLGCGVGDYSIMASELVGNTGSVVALDRATEALGILSEKASSLRRQNICTYTCDITKPLPLRSNTADVVLMATVLHMMRSQQISPLTIFHEIHRILRSDGRFAVLECIKKDMPFGPPKHARYSQEELETIIKPCGFTVRKIVDFEYNYLILFGKSASEI